MIVPNTKTIYVWPFYDAPEEYRNLSTHGGDEDWLAFVPDALENEYIPWMETHSSFGCAGVDRHKVEGGTVHIGAHS